MSFVLTRQHVPSDSSKLLFKVTGAPLAGTADDDYGEIISGLHQRADGAAWYYESQMIVSSAPWSMVGYLEDDPDMLVSDCHNHFLSVINMKPYTYPTHDGEMEVIASILPNHGVNPLFVTHKQTLNSDAGIQPYNVYHVWSHQNRMLAILQQTESDDRSRWIIQILQGSPLDFRVIGLLATQIEAEKFFLHSINFSQLMSAFVIALNVILVCCCMPSIVRWCKGPPRGSVVKQTNMLGKECHEQLMQKISIPRQQCHDLLQNSKYVESDPNKGDDRSRRVKGKERENSLRLEHDAPGFDKYEGSFGLDNDLQLLSTSVHASKKPVFEHVQRAVQGTWRESNEPSQRGWSVPSFRDESRGYADFRVDSLTRDVLENLPLRTFRSEEDKESDRKPKNLREWAKKYDPTLQPSS
uniref:Uncharacterized protein n=1 Tax=Hanusia phi TaxID=3032 RepID=A0A7S0NFL1_9CRYP